MYETSFKTVFVNISLLKTVKAGFVIALKLPPLLRGKSKRNQFWLIVTI